MENYAISSDKLSLPYCEYLDTKEPRMLLYGEIGKDIDCTLFARTLMTLDQIAKQRGYERICLLINSEGGEVETGMSIYDAMLTTKIPVDGYVTGRAASMAGVLLQGCRTRYMTKYAQQMLHNPSGSNDENRMAKAKKSLVTMLTRHGVSAKKISELMDKESWLSAEECKEMGLCDKIVDITTLNNTTADATIGWKQLEKVTNSLKPTPMKTIALALGLSENATETEITAKAGELGMTVKDGKLVKAEAVTEKVENKVKAEVSPEVKALMDSVKTLTDSLNNEKAQREANEKEQKITNKVAQLVKDGKIADDEATKTKVAADLKDAFDVASRLYDAMPGKVVVKAEKVTDLIAKAEGESTANKKVVDTLVVETEKKTEGVVLKADDGKIVDGMFVPTTPANAKKVSIQAAKKELLEAKK